MFRLAATLYFSDSRVNIFMKIINIPTVCRDNPKGKAYSQDLFIYHGGWNNTDGQINYRLDTLCVCFVEKGTYSMVLNSTEYTVESGDMFVCHPNDMIKNIYFSPDFYGTFIYANLDMISPYMTSTDIRQALLILRRKPVCHLSGGEYDLFLSSSRVLRIYEGYSATEDVVNSVLLTSTGLLLSVFRKILKEEIPASRDQAVSRPAMIYQDFLNLLISKTFKPHNIEYYAGELSVTPKYLSHVSKVQSGRSALEWIHEYIMNDAYRYLTSTDFSVKEIAAMLGFTNVSFFCRSVRKNFGKTPLAIRNAPIHSR